MLRNFQPTPSSISSKKKQERSLSRKHQKRKRELTSNNASVISVARKRGLGRGKGEASVSALIGCVVIPPPLESQPGMRGKSLAGGCRLMARIRFYERIRLLMHPGPAGRAIVLVVKTFGKWGQVEREEGENALVDR